MDKVQEIAELLKRLHQDHLHILNEIRWIRENARQLPEQALYPRLEKFFEFVHAHHVLEEEKLFPWLYQQSFLKAGGPKCTFFMGLVLDMKPYDELARKYGPVEKVRPQWMTEQSPLELPCYEHLWSVKLKELLKKGMSATPRSEPASETYQKLLEDYCRFVDFHRRKEDECLFPGIAQNLGIEST